MREGEQAYVIKAIFDKNQHEQKNNRQTQERSKRQQWFDVSLTELMVTKTKHTHFVINIKNMNENVKFAGFHIMVLDM